MSQRVEVEITPEGKMKMEFIGFAGEDCFDEAERIQNALVALGIRTDVVNTVRKPGGQIEAELGLDERDAAKVSTEK
jgi:hypothetical protein